MARKRRYEDESDVDYDPDPVYLDEKDDAVDPDLDTELEMQTPALTIREERPAPPRTFIGSEGGEGIEIHVDEEKQWYVIHCYSGYENKVMHAIRQRIETMGMQDKIFDVVVPTEEEIEVREGKRKTIERRVFPGYILVQMKMDEDSWYVVRNTPGVTGFVGMGNEPTALRPEEVSQIMRRMEDIAPKMKVDLQARPASADHRRAIQRFSRHSWRYRHGKSQSARNGVVLWPRNARRTGLLAGRKGVI